MYGSACYLAAPVQETMGDEVDFGWARMCFFHRDKELTDMIVMIVMIWNVGGMYSGFA